MLKQVIVIRKDLNMRKGKMVSQGAHASMKVLLDQAIYVASQLPEEENRAWLSVWYDKDLHEWFDGSFTKICLGCDNEQELLFLYEEAEKDPNIEFFALVTDNGTTEFNGEATNTAIAIGPAEAEYIDRITGHLKLL